MAENIKVVVTVDKSQLNSLQTEIQKLDGASIKIDTGKFAASMQQAAEATNKLSETTVRVNGELSKTITQTTEGIGLYKKTVQEAGEAGKRIETATTSFKEQRKYVAECAAAYESYKREVADNAPVTALQKQIEALTGIDAKTKSAAQSASVFEKDRIKYTAECAAEYEKYKQSLIDNAPRTAMQRQIEAMVGIGEQTKSAAESAKVFEKSLSNLSQKSGEAAQAEAKREAQTRKAAAAAQEAERRNNLLGDSLDRIIAKIFAWQTINAAIATVIRSFKNAIETMKEVDSALVTIRKVTDLTESQIESLTNKTYELATAYGRTADELLDLSATFARAGFGDQIEQMTELAALLENVGDIEGDTAAKFLLAANAAWQLGGDYDSLMGIIDGMNEVTNQAAVDMEALTNGITVAGSVFANAGETAQTYTAMVGTAVAATQRSGNEIARGLRTIAMNVRSIKGELEDGEIIDEESISKAAAALDSVGIHVADANGELRLTSDVLADLAHKWDTLTTAEQAYLAESLAGKRQANILTALMQNWGEVERQMQLYAEGAGSAMRENELYLDSWEAKTKILSAAWTEFISHLIETEQVKGILDGLTAVINAMDSGFGRAVITVLAFSAALLSVNKAAKGIAASKLVANITSFISAIKSATTATEAFQTALTSLGPGAFIAAAAAIAYGIAAAIDAITVSAEEATEAMRDAARSYDEAMSAVESLNEKLRQNIDLIVDASIAGKDDSYKQTLMEENELLREQIDEQLTLAEIAKQKEVENAGKLANMALAVPHTGMEKAAGVISDIAGLTGQYAAKQASDIIAGPSEEDIQAWIDARNVLQEYVEEQQAAGNACEEQVAQLARLNEQIDIYMATQQESNEAVRASVEAYDLLYDALEELSTSGEVSAETMSDLTKTFNRYAPELEKAAGNSADLAKVLLGLANELVGGQDAADGATSAFERMAVALDRSSDPAEWLAAVLNEDVTAFSNEEDAATNAAIQTEFFALKAALANGQPIDTSSAIASLSGLEGQSYNTAAALQALIAIFGQIGAMDASISHFSNMASTAVGRQGQHAANMLAAAASRKAGYDVTAEFTKLYQKYAGQYSGGGGGSNTGTKTGGGGGGGGGSKKGKSGGGGGSGSSEDPVLEAHKNLISLLEAELDLMEERGDSTDEQVAKVEEIQDALHAEAEYLRTIGGHEEDIVKLSAQWWKYEKEKAKLKEQELSMLKAELGLMQERGDSAEDQIEKMRAIQTALHEQADRLRGIQENSEDIVKLSEEWWKYENDIVKLKQEELELTTDLHKSELGLMKARGDDRQAYIAKQRQIQDDLHQEAEYLRSTKAYLDGDKETLAAINELSTEWWEIENDINDVLAEITDELADTATELVNAAEKEAKSALEAQLTLLKEQRDARKEAREEEEKLLAVEKARIALENAQKERNIRQYNASTGQWEWVANAKTVEAARESLEKAERDLADFYMDQAIDALEKNIETIEKGYDELRVAITSFADEVKSGTADLSQAFEYLIAKVKAAGIDVSGISGLEAAAAAAGGSMSAGKRVVAVQSDGNAPSGLSAGDQVVTAGGTYTIVPHGTPGATYNPTSGYSSVLTNSSQTTANTKSGSSGRISKPAINRNGRKAIAYDSGGILSGLGGIKATYADEMVLPPDATAGLLNAEKNGSFDALLSHLGIVTSAANRLAGFGAPVLKNTIGSQHNGDVYSINGVTIGEAQARSTTIYDFAQMAKLLALRNGA